jgi:biotin-dependent carboxylase-like uncharacterized protein
MRPALLVEQQGAALLLEDLGRPGHAGEGVPRSGALDRSSHRTANRLVGNPPEAATLEALLGGARLSALAPLWLAVTGAAGPLTVTGPNGPRPAPLSAAFPLADGERLEIGVAVHGLRYSIAVRGGFEGERVLGSLSTDTLSGLGPPPATAGTVLPVGAVPATPIPGVDWLPVSVPPVGGIALRVRPGPRLDRFEPSAWNVLTGAEWRISGAADRIGARLEGPPLRARRSGELPSEGMVTGGLQVPPSGAPILFLADHPTTGGYPVIAVVLREDLDLVAQLRPGRAVWFVPAGSAARAGSRFRPGTLRFPVD